MTFPTINHIDDVLPHLEGRQEFGVHYKDGYSVIDYHYVLPDSFDNPYRLECRGLKFGADGRIIARPLQKFHNVGEKPECTAENLDLSKPHIVMEKLDGSMIHPAIVNDEVVFMTRMGRTDVARKAERHLTPMVAEQCRINLEAGWTPVFEFTAPDNRIVVQYQQSSLTLLALRSTIHGYYSWQETVEITAQNMGVRAVPIHHAPTDARAFLAHTRAIKGMEGFVIRFADGFMVKAKGEDYVLKHRAKESVLQEKNVLALIVRDELDDVLPLLDAPDRANVERYRADVLSGINEAADILSRMVEAGKGVDQKTFATVLLKGVIPQVRSLAFQVRAGANPRDAILSSIIKSSTSASGVDHVRPLFNATFHAANDNTSSQVVAA
ncbi:MAG: RNA ligase [Xanthobacteraceae bacterium]